MRKVEEVTGETIYTEIPKEIANMVRTDVGTYYSYYELFDDNNITRYIVQDNIIAQHVADRYNLNIRKISFTHMFKIEN